MFALRTLLAASLAALAFSATSSTAAPTSLQARDRFYRPTFIAQTCATSSPDYLTYSLVATPGACQNFCDSVNGCVFANSYNDINSQGQNGNNKGLAGNALLTCALFSKTHTANDGTLNNCGGQDQTGSGLKNYIVNSSGYAVVGQ